MNITKFGDKYIIYDDSVTNISKLDNAVYKVEFNKQFGLHLVKYADKFSNNEKVFGNYESKVNRAFKLFNNRDKNLGVLMTGKKGMGKSFCAKELCNKCLDNGFPVIIIDSSFDTNDIEVKTIPDFFGKIKQDIVVFFDEFEKVFSIYTEDNGHNDVDPQEDLLSMFDGANSSYKRLFIVTSNNVRDINEYFLNRPGRFHYHFKFTFPTSNEVREYITYYCKDIDPNELEDIILFTDIHPLTYDCLNAIVTEIKYGGKFKDFIEDLNISNDEDEFIYEFYIVFGVMRFKYKLNDAYNFDETDEEALNTFIDYLSKKDNTRIRIDSYDYDNDLEIYTDDLHLNSWNSIMDKPLTYYKTDKNGLFRIPIKKEQIESIYIGVNGTKNDKKVCPVEEELGIKFNDMDGADGDKAVSKYAMKCIEENKAYFEIRIVKNSGYYTGNVLQYLM